ncbi:MAG: glycosyltransferase family 39 protein [Myxococcota bacterium]|nr:glycosyltransferase family 39 protein [Myxococcota bacterium]
MTSPAAADSARPVFWAWALLSLCVLFSALPAIEDLGLYYDEAFLAPQARGFVEPDRAGLHPASVRSLEIAGRPFPIRNAAYLGSLKSQLLIPAFATAGASVRVLRIATLCTALIALLFAMLWAGRIFGGAAAIIMGALVASDPSFYFFSQFEWGPFTTNFLCRAVGALAVVIAWQSASSRRATLAAAIAGLSLGLGIYSRADFALILACAGLALLFGQPDLPRRAWQEKRGALVAGTLGLLLASLPMLFSSLELLASTQAIRGRGDLPFRFDVLWHVLDGSQFHRVMLTGGIFERAPDATSPGGWLGFIGLASALVLVWSLVQAFRQQGSGARRDPRLFLLVTTGLLLLVMLALPGAVRAHHQLNLLPLVQLIVACAALDVWQSRSPSVGRGLGRAGVVLALGLLLLGNANVILETRSDMARTEGRGRFSAGLRELAARLDAQPNARAVSLDWGFHEPLLFLTKRAQMIEPIWGIPHQVAKEGVWRLDGDGHTTYLIHGPEYDLMGIGPSLLVAERTNPELGSRIESHRDGDNEIAFYTVVIEKPHTLHFNGKFRLTARGDPGS